jgi:hypothetical protein
MASGATDHADLIELEHTAHALIDAADDYHTFVLQIAELPEEMEPDIRELVSTLNKLIRALRSASDDAATALEPVHDELGGLYFGMLRPTISGYKGASRCEALAFFGSRLLQETYRAIDSLTPPEEWDTKLKKGWQHGITPGAARPICRRVAESFQQVDVFSNVHLLIDEELEAATLHRLETLSIEQEQQPKAEHSQPEEKGMVTLMLEDPKHTTDELAATVLKLVQAKCEPQSIPQQRNIVFAYLKDFEARTPAQIRDTWRATKRTPPIDQGRKGANNVEEYIRRGRELLGL